MTSIKTLKDINKFYPLDDSPDELIKTKELKAEVVKWVKNEKGYHNKFRDARADVLIEFFNLTEEDLK